MAPAVGVELLARLEDDGVQSALGVGQLHAVADDERAAARGSSRRSPGPSARGLGGPAIAGVHGGPYGAADALHGSAVSELSEART